VNAAATRISLALLSHTNAGKTTLARTLLREDIGAVADRAHVTEVAESFLLMRSAAGDELWLWDTPGFGDSVRLLKRLQGRGHPLGWFLSQVWDRYAEKPFWCSQQALRAARDSADLLLYVVDATQHPDSAGYLEAELQILDWTARPALVLVNQLGTDGDAERDTRILEQWAATMERLAPGRVRVLSFDAFARCWLQEHVLLDAIAGRLPAGQAAGVARVAAAWRERDLAVLERSAAVLAAQLAATAQDEERVADRSLRERVRALWRGPGGDADSAEQAAQAALMQRLDGRVRNSTQELAGLHGLVGDAGANIVQRLGREFSVDRPADADRAGFLGGLVSGALTGLAADLAAGGLTGGVGALIGGLAGGFGARKLTQQYNAARGRDGSGVVRWSDEFLEARLAAALSRYLAVAHFGRGRGAFQDGATPARWREAVVAALQSAATQRAGLWDEVRGAGAGPARLQQVVAGLLSAVLARLYPEASGVLKRS
jgi:hypothetical protein